MIIGVSPLLREMSSTIYKTLGLVFVLITTSYRVAGQACDLQLASDHVDPATGDLLFYVGDTVRFTVHSGSACAACTPVCTTCGKIDYTLTNGVFRWVPDVTLRDFRTALKFVAGCKASDSTVKKSILSVNVRVARFPHVFHVDDDRKTSPAVRAELIDFMRRSETRITQLTVQEGDTIAFKIFTPPNEPGRLTVIPSNPAFNGIVSADTKSVSVFWVPDYREFKISPIHDLRLSLVNGALPTDPNQVTKVIRFKVLLLHNRPPMVDRTRSTIVELDPKGDTEINAADYFFPVYDRSDDPLQFDFAPKNTPCIKPNAPDAHEIVIRKSLYLIAQPKPTELVIRARHSNSPYSEDVHLTLKSHFEPLSLALENRRFSFYDGDKIDELIKVDSNEPYRLDLTHVEVLGDTDLFNLKKVLRFEDQNPLYLRLFTTKPVEVDDAITDDLRFTVTLKFINALNKESDQTITISIHPRVNGDVARSFFKKQIDSVRSMLDSIRYWEVQIGKIRDHKASRLDWYSKGISFVAIIIGSYGTAKNSSNYGYSIMAGLALGALFVDLKQINFFLTKGYRKANTAADGLERLESDVEKLLITDTDKMGGSFFEANYRTSEARDYHNLVTRFREILHKFHAAD
jgi:hypothetical protein